MIIKGVETFKFFRDSETSFERSYMAEGLIVSEDRIFENVSF